MAEVRVTKQFKENFDLWASDVVAFGDWTTEEIDGFKRLLREHELADGPDTLRDTLVHYTPDGHEKPSAINDPKERYQYWSSYFQSKADEIRRRQMVGVGNKKRNAA